MRFIVFIIVAIILAIKGYYMPLIFLGAIFLLSCLVVFIIDLFTPEDKKKQKNKKFKKVQYEGSMTLRSNFDGTINNPSWEQVEASINKFFTNIDDVVVLSLPQSEYGVKFMQVCMVKDVISVRLGLVSDQGDKLVEKRFAKSSIIPLYKKYYQYGYVDMVEEFYALRTRG